MPGLVDGKVALVTGAGSGIGRATALAFAREGAKVVVADRVPQGANQTVEMIVDTGGQATFVACDVSQASEVEALIANAVAVYGRLDCAHNNAGISTGRRAFTADVAEEDWERVIAVNLKGVWLCLKYELQQMQKQGSGAIVNTASVAGLVGIAGNVGYVASKHGVVGLTRGAALEYAPAGIRVNAVCPGYIDTPMIASRLEEPAARAAIVARHPIGRLGAPNEIAEAVIWLCSDAASFATGHAMTVDGGYAAQ